MDRLAKILQFIAWPAVCGILVAIVLLQYQQLERLGTATAPVKPPAPAPTTSFADAIQRAAPSVVSIHATSFNIESVERADEDELEVALSESASLGSGVIIDARGYILTNLHVVNSVFFDTEVTLSDGRHTPATVVAWDSEMDLAVLHINMQDLAPVKIGDEHQLDVGDIVFAIGYPRNIGQSVSQGIISALSLGTEQNSTFIQTDAAINPGNSGGALINADGELIGINSSILSESGNFEGIGFATPAGIAITASYEMIADAVDSNSGYLGVLTGEALNEQSSQLFFGVDHIRGMLVESVDEGGAAELAGIETGDVITQIGDTVVEDGQNIMMEIRNTKPGDTINVHVYRDGRTLRFPVTLGFGHAVVIEL